MSVDPLADKYPGWNPYHYVHNNPVKLIDPDGMEAEADFYDNKGNYIGNDGKIYVLNSKSIDYKGMSCDDLKSNSTEVQISTGSNKRSTFRNWAKKYKGLSDRDSNDPKGDREFAMTLYSGSINTPNGEKEVFAHGSLIEGRKGVNGVSLVDSKSPIEGWNPAETIHTHRFGSTDNFSNDPFTLVGSDVPTAVKSKNTLYLAVPHSNFIGSFNPKAYTKYIQNGKTRERAQRYSTDKKAIRIW